MQDKNTCCNQECNQGRDCPVRNGTHKPSEAVHQIQETAPVIAVQPEAIQALRALHDSVELAMQRGALSERALEIIIMQPATDVLMRAASQAAPAAVAEQALLRVLHAIQRYLPPDGTSERDTLNEIIGVVDPWPLGMVPAAADSPDERAAFEAWALVNAIRTDLGAWEAWKGRAALPEVSAPAAMAATEDERAAWFALAMNAAAYIEDAAACLRDGDAKRAATGAAKHVREKCNALWDSAPQAQEGQA